MVGTGGGGGGYETIENSIITPHLSSKLSLNPYHADSGLVCCIFYL